MRLLVFLITLLAMIPTHALIAQTFWAKSQSGTNINEALAVTGDAAGNVYSTGYFSSLASVSGINLTVEGLTDIFVTKIGQNGTTLWSIGAGGSQSDRGLGISTDPEGNVLVCGFFTGSVDFGNGVSITTVSGSQDAFLAKFDPEGIIIWARSGGSPGNSDRANGVATDAAGNIFITGQFTGEVEFGSLSINSATTSNDIFIVKYDADGNELWARTGSGEGLNRGLAVTSDDAGDVYVTGQLSGDITFDNTYPNAILNALFLVKYDQDGDEVWVRLAGGSGQSIGYGLASDGTEIFLTGDCGQNITFVDPGGNTTFTTGYSDAVFIAAFNSAGYLEWAEGMGSESPVSSRGISYFDGQIGITGWFECTFDGLSDYYGEGLFNNIGFKDVFVMRYSSGGDFVRGRNIGSRTEEFASGIHILPDNLEVISGTFNITLYIPTQNITNTPGLSFVPNSPNPGLTYCGDAHYGQFSRLLGDVQQDGFLIKAINPEREPYDFYMRDLSMDCDQGIPLTCITLQGNDSNTVCPDSLVECAPYTVVANNYVHTGLNALGYNMQYQWTPVGIGPTDQITSEGEVSVVITSEDGCYQSEASVFADVFPSPPKPLMSDNVVVNDEANITLPVYLCPGDTIQLWSNVAPDADFSWLGPGGTSDSDTIEVTLPGVYFINVTNAFGCHSGNSVMVIYQSEPPPLMSPFINFLIEGDTMEICSGGGGVAHAYDSLTMEIIDHPDIDMEWSISPAGTISGEQIGAFSVPESGWYSFTLELEMEDNLCFEVPEDYTVNDSIYIQLLPSPDVEVFISGPSHVCPDQEFMVYVSSNADETTYSFDAIEDYGDSLLVTGTGFYYIEGFTENEVGCWDIQEWFIFVDEVAQPLIVSDPANAVVCPGDSILLSTNTDAESYLWQGPGGNTGTGTTTYASQAGLYFLEVTFNDDCALVSNTLQVSEYTTPFLQGSGALDCPGDSVLLEIFGNSLENIQWLSPLSGNANPQIITQAGLYTVMVSGCGITTELTVGVDYTGPEVVIEQPDMDVVCEGDSILVQASPGFETYLWAPEGNGISTYFYTSGTVQVQATDSNGCAVFSNIIGLNFEPLPPLPSFGYELVCEGEEQVVSVLNDDFNVQWVIGSSGNVYSDTNFQTIDPFIADTSLYAFLTSEYCTGPLDSLLLGPKPYPEEPIIGSDAPVCTGNNLSLVVLNPEANTTYQWTTASGDERTGASVNYFVDDAGDIGTYFCYADLDGCISDTIPIEIDLYITREVVLPSDTVVCATSEYIIKTDTVFETYLWQNGSENAEYTLTGPGNYFLQVTDFNGCASNASGFIDLVDCEIIVPNIFTPNGDGENDWWFVSTGQPKKFRVVIYNRWGRVVFESINIAQFWNGSHYKTNEDCSEGVYFYIIDVQNFTGAQYQLTGNVTLLRN